MPSRACYAPFGGLPRFGLEAREDGVAWRRRRRQDALLAGYQELCRELGRAGPETFGELDVTGTRPVLRR